MLLTSIFFLLGRVPEMIIIMLLSSIYFLQGRVPAAVRNHQHHRGGVVLRAGPQQCHHHCRETPELRPPPVPHEGRRLQQVGL